ncbi:MOSC domain-containing protein [Streptomyces sp. NPDC058459]|uniref:MOSC domain-containing protein n=1 Tax=Streptomyces sp. NPDC058459 TaxID=3346508 RepID=UPI003667604F
MARLVAVNVGMPRDVPWRGRTVHTGVFKQPVSGPRMVRQLNIDGDGQGDLEGHGGAERAVLVYQTDSYRFWSQRLGRDDLEPGNFGENFTVDGLADDEVCVGDRYRVGEALFEVTQPRVTCYRVGLRLGEPRMAALLVAEHRPGFYLRVVQEGRVQAGEEIVKVSTGPEAMTVEEIDAVLYLPGHTMEQVERALRIPALSPGWHSSMEALREQAANGAVAGTGSAGLTTAATGPPPAWGGFRALGVASVEAESREVVSLSLASPDGAALPRPLPGQYLTVRVRVDGEDAPLIRNYSLSGDPGADRYRISVKHEPHGQVSHHLHTRVRAGDELDVAAPRGTFTLPDADTPVVLMSAGVGVTPVLAMLHAVAARGGERRVQWLHVARSRAEHAFAAEVAELIERLPNAESTVYYSRPGQDDVPGVDYTVAGRPTARHLPGLDAPAQADAYLCGPVAFMEEMTKALVEAGLARSRVHIENFGSGPSLTPGIKGGPRTAAPHQPPGRPGTGPMVSFARAGLALPWNDERESLLELAEACDVPVRWSCRTGVCHTCELALLSGTVDYAPSPVEPPADGNILICCSKPTEDVVLDA